MTGIKIYLKYSSKDKLQLPVVPEELTLESPFGVNKVNVADCLTQSLAEIITKTEGSPAA